MTKNKPKKEVESDDPENSESISAQPEKTLHELKFDEPLIYKTVSEQIGAEERQIEKRMGWTLTFNGLLFAAFALIAKDTIDPMVKQLLKHAIPMVGIVSAWLGLMGILAAYRQIKVQTNYWNARTESQAALNQLPRIFGTGKIHTDGKYPSIGNPLVLMIVWLGIYIAVFVEGCSFNRAIDSNVILPLESTSGSIESVENEIIRNNETKKNLKPLSSD